MDVDFLFRPSYFFRAGLFCSRESFAAAIRVVHYFFCVENRCLLDDCVFFSCLLPPCGYIPEQEKHNMCYTI